MSKCISSHGEYSEHEPGDPCPWCGEWDTERIIAERDEALARIKAVRVALSSHPRACEKHPDDHLIGCGWKSAVLDVQDALDRSAEQ